MNFFNLAILAIVALLGMVTAAPRDPLIERGAGSAVAEPWSSDEIFTVLPNSALFSVQTGPDMPSGASVAASVDGNLLYTTTSVYQPVDSTSNHAEHAAGIEAAGYKPCTTSSLSFTLLNTSTFTNEPVVTLTTYTSPTTLLATVTPTFTTPLTISDGTFASESLAIVSSDASSWEEPVTTHFARVDAPHLSINCSNIGSLGPIATHSSSVTVFDTSALTSKPIARSSEEIFSILPISETISTTFLVPSHRPRAAMSSSRVRITGGY
ncbi:hypothetical protein B0J12DRAFT_752786 [Macrophomina phaseolina]|uniref:Uncharacterized protein n=1 Tax=Macrophomina phaseolina TaxID=35725 RepID=A0ABQ8GCD4_9PEZI|nr:hypothetical protein B0J12DRAFT_752786 [Macrophomina phaseolina]